jgi:hypothetical protein
LSNSITDCLAYDFGNAFYATGLSLPYLHPACKPTRGRTNSHWHRSPTGWHVTVPAEGDLIFQMKVDGQGPYRTGFDTAQLTS